MTNRLEMTFDATAVHPTQRLRRWQEIIGDHLADVDMRRAAGVSIAQAFDGTMALSSSPGVTIARVTSAGHRLTRTPSRIRRADRETALVNIMISGNCHFEQEGRRSILRPGDLCIYESVRPYEIVAANPFDVLVVMVERSRMEAALGNLRLHTGARIDGHSAAACLAQRFWRDLAANWAKLSASELTALTSSGLDLLRIAAGSADNARWGARSGGSESLRRAICFMRDHLARPSLSPVEIAGATGLSLRRLQEVFQQSGMTVMGELRTMRLRAAQCRLADQYCESASIQSVMESVGWLDQAHFSRAFKQAFGLSPRAYRRDRVRSGSGAGGPGT